MRVIVNIRMLPSQYKELYNILNKEAKAIHSVLRSRKLVTILEGRIYDLFWDKFKNKADNWDGKQEKLYNFKLKVSEAKLLHEYLADLLNETKGVDYAMVQLYQIFWHLDVQLVNFYEKISFNHHIYEDSGISSEVPTIRQTA